MFSINNLISGIFIFFYTCCLSGYRIFYGKGWLWKYYNKHLNREGLFWLKKKWSGLGSGLESFKYYEPGTVFHFLFLPSFLQAVGVIYKSCQNHKTPTPKRNLPTKEKKGWQPKKKENNSVVHVGNWWNCLVYHYLMLHQCS